MPGWYKTRTEVAQRRPEAWLKLKYTQFNNLAFQSRKMCDQEVAKRSQENHESFIVTGRYPLE